MVQSMSIFFENLKRHNIFDRILVFVELGGGGIPPKAIV